MRHAMEDVLMVRVKEMGLEQSGLERREHGAIVEEDGSEDSLFGIDVYRKFFCKFWRKRLSPVYGDRWIHLLAGLSKEFGMQS